MNTTLRAKPRRRLALFPIRFVAVFAIAASISTPNALAQSTADFPVSGYITAIRPTTGSVTELDVSGDMHVTVTSTTCFGTLGSTAASSISPLRKKIQIGTFIAVSGELDKQTHTAQAQAIYLRGGAVLDEHRTISGVGVIDKVLSVGPEPVFRADGYILRIPATADLTFSDSLNSLADVGTNIWVSYEAKSGDSNEFIVSKATFLPPKPSKFNALTEVADQPITVELPHAVPSAHKEKQRYSETGIRFKAIDDNALQARIQRIGASVVPAYQKALPNDHPSKINFQFYAVDNQKHRSVLCSNDGLVLLPQPVLERLKTDDQLAAILAEGVAYQLQRQAARISRENRTLIGAGLAVDAAGALVPGLAIANMAGWNPAERKLYTAMEQQRSRVALALLSDAGYDLRQAPEVWRLLSPKHLPDDINTLKYPEQSAYQWEIIRQLYSNPAPPANTLSEARAIPTETLR